MKRVPFEEAPSSPPTQKLARDEQPRVNWKALDDFVSANKPEGRAARQSKVTGT
ncbi:MAG: hypothetical protein KTR31_40485 [Myxococcales bacterium]|nr:hypothetical protein [Myxococcales bacterium]